MKKLFLIAIFAASIQVSYAQMLGGRKPTGCAEEGLNSLKSCLSSKGINYKMTGNVNETVYITAEGNVPAGQIQSCIAHYNQTVRRPECPEAPEVVYVKNNNGKKDE